VLKRKGVRKQDKKIGTMFGPDTNDDLDVDQGRLNELARKLVILKQKGKKKE
jgi:hypothetical protein